MGLVQNGNYEKDYFDNICGFIIIDNYLWNRFYYELFFSNKVFC